MGGRGPTFGDVSEGRLTYTQHVIKEVLRMHPPIHMFPRLATAADTMPTGHKVAAGDIILLSTWAMGRNPRVWEDPERFDPDRFSDERLTQLATEQADKDATPDEIDRAVTMLKRYVIGPFPDPKICPYSYQKGLLPLTVCPYIAIYSSCEGTSSLCPDCSDRLW